jgi:hypothetical protein
LLAATALAPLCFLASQTASAQTTSATATVSSSTSTPVTTLNTTTNGGTLTINSGVSIQPAAPNTSAVTVNSNASLSNLGTLSYSGVNNVVGLTLQGGYAGTIVNDGVIDVTESFTPSDPNNNGVNAEPFASVSSTSRYGIYLAPGAPFTGELENQLTIEVQGNNSYGILLQAPLIGDIIDTGTIAVTGASTTPGVAAGAGLLETGGVSGNVTIEGTVTALGKYTNAVDLAGGVGGRVSVYAALSSTDYGDTTRVAAGTTLQTIEANTAETDPNSGSALIVGGNVGAGVIIGAPPTYTNSADSTSDRDGDGTVDSVETTGTVTTYGAAPAMIIGGSTNTTIGGFVAASSTDFTNGYGVIIEGDVYGYGVYDNVSSTALQIGGQGGTTTIAGGLLVAGDVEATGYGDTQTTAIHIGTGASLPTINNLGLISASVSPPNSTSSNYTAFTATATAISIDPGATVSGLVNSGTIQALIEGDQNDTVSVIAVQDKGGGISSVTNTGTISASFTADAVGAIVTGTPVTLANGTKDANGTVALDLSNNTTGVTLVQSQPPNTVVTTVTTSGVPVVTVSYQPIPAGTLAITTTVTETTTTTGNTSVETIVPVSPSITGDIYLGNGPNTVSILAGTVAGAISMGSGPTASVTLDNGAIYEGALSYSGTSGAGLTINVNNGTFDNTSPTTFKTASFTIGSKGLLYFGVDPLNNRAALYTVSGAATVAAGGQIGLVFDSNATKAQTYTLLTAGSLNIAASATALLGPVPYMFNAALTPNAATGTISLTISPKTPAELGLNPSQSAALGATYNALTYDLPVQAAFLGQYTKSGFLGVYNQILPDYAGGTFQAANAASLAIGRATSEANNIENPTGSRGAWVQELFVGVNQGVGQTDGFRGGGFGFVGGVETGGSGLGAFGVTAAIVETTIADPHVPGDSQTAMSQMEVGGYWQGEINGFTADARIGGGYLWMAGRREFIETDSAGDISLDRKVKDNWNGYTLSGRFGLAYKYSFNDRFLGGGWFVQPETHLDTFFMYLNSYNESQLQWPDGALAIGSVDGNETSGTASILIGRKIGTGIVFRPELEFGVRDVFTGTAGDTPARYLVGGPSFTLTPQDITGPAGVARFKLKASSEYYELGLEAGGEINGSRYEEVDSKISFRVLF